MELETLKQWDEQYIAGTYARFDLGAASGSGVTCTDLDGKEYIDFSSGIGVNSLGFCDEGWVQAVCNQAKTLQHLSNLYYTQPGTRLAKLLCEKTGYQKVFFANSGAEANEGAIKTARKYSFDRYGEGRFEIVSLKNSFHGRTITTLTATGQDVFHRYFMPFTEGFTYASAQDIDDVKRCITDKTCAVMLEFIQGEGGVVPLEDSFVKELFDYCSKRDILVIADEVQTGVGRTGKFFCFEHFGVRPDVVTAAKGLGGGLPIGAVLFGEKTQNVLGLSDHGTTFGGNPVACAGACEVLKRLDDAFLAEVGKKGDYLKQKLLQLPEVQSVTGKGLMLGVTLAKGDSKTAAKKALEHGLIVLTAKEKVRFLPPLVIDYKEIDEGLARFAQALQEL